ncbi:MAG: hypothetical protein JXJ22_14590 [Bacteroidales bacterium]|nr:hypothetical protein [Bacteroidales bacterium]
MKGIKDLFKALTLIFVISVCLASCEYNKKEEIQIGDLPDPILYGEHIQPIFNTNCITCHNGSTPPNLTVDNSFFELTAGGYINVDNPEDSKFYKKISGSGSMAQYASDLDRAYILKWIEQGANDD